MKQGVLVYFIFIVNENATFYRAGILCLFVFCWVSIFPPFFISHFFESHPHPQYHLSCLTKRIKKFAEIVCWGNPKSCFSQINRKHEGA
ncbi:hypothetical protein I3842_10G047800 [Carya illinoinensis]|uniref:Uncharacterized protein n=1 Tax=Carya illinoinensis TaxID=32201 RepID=A0A922DUH5_CARIL|nr:hypothetical protein I3842_10G047800 [Carya illinoinensis]